MTKDSAEKKGGGFRDVDLTPVTSFGIERADTDPEFATWDGRENREVFGGRMTSPLQTSEIGAALGGLVETPAPALTDVTELIGRMPAAMAALEGGANADASLAVAVTETKSLIMGLLQVVREESERNRRLRESLKQLIAELKRNHIEKYTDALTGLPNQRALFEFVAKLFEVYAGPNVPFSVILIDLDLFHDLNSKHGYEGGDFVLREISKIIQSELRRSGDACFNQVGDGLKHMVPTRAGGEELMVVLPETSLHGAAEVAKKLWVAISKHGFLFKGEKVLVTASLGVAQVDYSKHKNFDEIRVPANEALDVCKGESRDASGAVRQRNGVYQHDGSVISRVAQGERREKSSRDKNPALRIKLRNLFYFAGELMRNIKKSLFEKAAQSRLLDKE